MLSDLATVSIRARAMRRVRFKSKICKVHTRDFEIAQHTLQMRLFGEIGGATVEGTGSKH